ncbi:TPA: hypothetical protein I9279_001851 [Serratia marcescens]|nr:hypothetical protein [Serratia marcescens]HAT4512959.1 hypothetical protein [Serratia marcescens]HAT4536511.1 hypothetical protein [Serratia marcescens]
MEHSPGVGLTGSGMPGPSADGCYYRAQQDIQVMWLPATTVKNYIACNFVALNPTESTLSADTPSPNKCFPEN